MAKFCSNCGNEICDESVICVKCGTMVSSNKANNKGKFPTWAIILIVVLCTAIIPFIMFAFLAYVGFKYFDVASMVNNVEHVVSHGSYGDSLSDGVIDISLTDVSVYSDINGNSASDGMEYLVFFFDIDNVSDDSFSISRHNFSGYVDEGRIDSIKLDVDINGYKPLEAILDDGEGTLGYVAYEVDTDWKDFSIYYRSDALGFDSIVFDISNTSYKYK